jgi:hypothetical protein
VDRFCKVLKSELFSQLECQSGPFLQLSLKLLDGSVVAEHDQNATILLNSIKDKLGCSEHGKMSFNLDTLIQSVIIADMYTPFSREEIDVLVKELTTDKAPGADGFNGMFIKHRWHIVKNDFYALYDVFYEGNLDLRSLNVSFITLVPKVSSPEIVNDYRPISHLGGSISLVVANKVQRMITFLVHKKQYGFIKQRTSQDCLTWAFQYIYICHCSKKEIVTSKLDFESLR